MNIKINKYHTWYNSLIERARNRVIGGYIEKHHIIPRSLGGTDDPENLVDLTAREHLIAHMLLPRFVETPGPMWQALWCMVQMGEVRVTGRLYEQARIKRAEVLSAARKGRPNPKVSAALKGKPGHWKGCKRPGHSAILKGRPNPKVSAALKGRPNPKVSAALKGRPNPKVSAALKGRPNPKVSAALKGRKRPDISAAMKGRPNPKVSAALKGRPNLALKGRKRPGHSAIMKGRPWSPARIAAQEARRRDLSNKVI